MHQSMALTRQDKFLYGLLTFIAIALFLWTVDIGPGHISVEISFVGYTNGPNGKQALFRLKNSGPDTVLRDESCTITWSDSKGSNHVDFFRLDPKVAEIKQGRSEVVPVPVTNALSWRVDFGFWMLPTTLDAIQTHVPWRFTKRNETLSVFIGPTLTNTPEGGVLQIDRFDSEWLRELPAANPKR
jgi:hypothetical protein